MKTSIRNVKFCKKIRLNTMFITAVCVILLKIHMKNLLDSDWPRAVQFKCNTSAISVTPVQITHRNSG